MTQGNARWGWIALHLSPLSHTMPCPAMPYSEFDDGQSVDWCDDDFSVLICLRTS